MRIRDCDCSCHVNPATSSEGILLPIFEDGNVVDEEYCCFCW